MSVDYRSIRSCSGDTEIELGFDAASLREFVDMGTAMLAEMDTQHEREEAGEATQASLPAAVTV